MEKAVRCFILWNLCPAMSFYNHHHYQMMMMTSFRILFGEKAGLLCLVRESDAVFSLAKGGGRVKIIKISMIMIR